MITIIKYGQNLIKLLHFNSVVAITILFYYDCLIRIQDAFTSLLLRVILIVSACFYMDMSCFGPVQPSISTPRKKVLPDYFFPSEKVLPKYLLPREKVLQSGKKCSPILKFWLHVSCNTLLGAFFPKKDILPKKSFRSTLEFRMFW